MATILVVDDLATNRELLVTLLKYQGHRLLEAADGAKGLALSRAEHPDLVITDVLMPIMDGYALVRELRLDPATQSIPVVFYTAHYGEREARALALSSGVSYVLTKPAEPEEVLKIVGRALSGESDTGSERHTPLTATEFDREHLRLVTDKLSENVWELRTSNARLRALINIGLELASERDGGQLLETVCSAARDLFGATYVTLGIVDLNERTIRGVVASGMDDVARCGRAGDTPSGILQTVVGERKTLRGDNPGGDPSRLHLPPSHPPVNAYLVAPIASPANVYGWLCLVNNDGGRFAEDDEDLVRALSGQVGRIYENGHFYSIARQRAVELEREILERYQAVEALRASEERTQFALKSAGVGIWEMNYTTGVLRWSDVLEAQYGLPPGTFSGTFEAYVERVHPDDRPALLAAMAKATASGEDFSVQHRALWPDGTVRWLSGAGRIVNGENGEPLRGVGISLDVTERRVLEQQYQQAQKMEAVGRLAGGIAHDFNNLLTAILGYSEVLLADMGEDPSLREDVAQIQKAATSATALTGQLLAFSRKQIVEPKLLDLNAVAADMKGMLTRLIGEDVTVTLALAPDLAPVLADRGQIEQIILNLAVNARDAMPAGGEVTIETSVEELDEDYAKMHLSAKPGTYVALSVTDTGTGLSPEARAHLFEPFFTTKEAGKGTGLGLATVYGIVTQYGGYVGVYSEAGKGTSFNLYFPKADGTAPVAAAPHPPSRAWTGTETILVVEDMAGLRALTHKMLERLGYKVLLATNADDALRWFQQDVPIDVVLTDVIMPGLSGPQLTRQLAELRPDLKVIFMSGYTDETIVRHGILEPGIAFLHKPFSSEALGRKIREVLEP